jgi:glutamyl-tRNA reductase
MSAATAAVTLIEGRLTTLAGRSVVVIGAGQAGRQALERLARRGVSRLFIASRSVRHARDAADTVGAVPIGLDRVVPALADADALIAATTSPALVVTASAARPVLEPRAGRPVVAVDLSVPRVVDPALAGRPGISLHTVDDLGDIVRESTARRLGEVPNVEAIARDEAQRAYDRFRARLERASA